MATAQTVRSIQERNTVLRESWPVALRLAGIPEPVKDCDGASWRVPFWNPETKRWGLESYEGGPVLRLLPLAQCPVPDCDALHEEDFKDTETLRRIQMRLAKVQTRVKARE